MKKDFTITNNIDIEEKKRIAEIKSLSYLRKLRTIDDSYRSFRYITRSE